MRPELRVGISLAVATVGLFVPILTMPHFSAALSQAQVPYGSAVAQVLARLATPNGWDSSILLGEGLWLSAMALAAVAFAAPGTIPPRMPVRAATWPIYGMAALSGAWSIFLLWELADGGCTFNPSAPWNCPWGN